MFGLVLINSSDLRRQILQELAIETRFVTILHSEHHYPAPYELSRLASAYTPEIVLIDLDDPARALACASEMHSHNPTAAIIGVGGDWIDPELLARTGLAYRLRYPPTVDELAATLRDAIHASQGGPIANLLAFLPAKAGCGASTVALNSAAAVSGAFGKRVLVIDGDLRSGVMSIMINGVSAGSTQTALTSAHQMDSFLWDSVVTRVHGIDLLLSSRTPVHPLPDWNQYFELLRFLKTRYDYILVDLPELVNEATAEIVRRARLVFLVTTQEILSLKLAEQRRQELHDWGVSTEHLRVLLNRWHKAQIGAKDVEQFLGHPVMAKFPNDYATVRSATMAGHPVPSNSDLGRAFHQFATQLAGDTVAGPGWLDRLRGLTGRKLTPA
jgi:pilus assembly protein CpaE